MTRSLTLLLLLTSLGCPGEPTSDAGGQTADTSVDDTGVDDTGDCAPEDRDCAGACFGSAVVDDCGTCDADASNDCVTSVAIAGEWQCAQSTDCQDVYLLDFAAGADVTLAVADVTGASVTRLAVFPPGSSLDADNLLVGNANDWSCNGQDAGESTSFVTGDAGTYIVVVGRDWGRSAGANGTYALTVSSDAGIEGSTTPALNDVESEFDRFVCGYAYTFEGEWDCEGSDSCQDTFLVELAADSALTLSAAELTGNSVPRMAVYAPSDAAGALNLLTNTANDRECVGQNQDDRAAPLAISAAGTYTVALTRDWGSSAGGAGTYRFEIQSDTRFPRPTLGADDQISPAPTSQCPWTWTVNGEWSCALSESCQDVFDVGLTQGAFRTVVTEVTGGSVVRLAAFEPGVALSGNNLLLDSTVDYECTGQNEAVTSPTLQVRNPGIYRLAVGRDWGSSAGAVGTYTATVEVYDGYGSIPTATVDDGVSQASGSDCP